MTKDKSPSKKDLLITQLTKDLTQYKAMDIMTLFLAHNDVQKLTTQRYMASGLIVTITDLSLKPVCGPFMIQNGLSPETIDALKADIKATYDHRLAIPQIKGT